MKNRYLFVIGLCLVIAAAGALISPFSSSLPDGLERAVLSAGCAADGAKPSDGPRQAARAFSSLAGVAAAMGLVFLMAGRKT